MSVLRSCSTAWSSISRRQGAPRESSSGQLERCLTGADLVFVGIGAMLGAGIYILPGEVAGEMAGPAAVLSFLVAGLVAMLNGLCFLECAGRLPRAGAAYVYAYASLGELAAFLVGWNAVAARVLALVYLAQGWSAYLDSVIGGRMQNLTVEVVLRGEEWDAPLLASFPDFAAGAAVLLGSIPVMLGAGTFAAANSVLVLLNVAVVVLLSVVSAIHADLSLLTKHGFFPLGLAGVARGAGAAFVGFCGFEAIGLSSEEARNPGRDLPVGLAGAFGACLLAYPAAALSVAVLADYREIQPRTSFASAFGRIAGLDWARYAVSLGALSGTSGGLLSHSYCLSRIVYPMSRDGLLPARLAETNERTKTPLWAIASGALLSAVLSVLLDFASVVHLMSLVDLLELAVVCVAVVVLRYGPRDQSCCPTTDGATGPAGSDSMIELNRRDRETVTESTTLIGPDRVLNSPAYSPSGFATISSRVLRTIRRHPRRTVISSLGCHVVAEVVLVALLTNRWEDLRRLEGAVLFWILVSGALAVTACLPLLCVPRYDEEIPFKVPLMPWLPLFTTLCDVILICQLDGLSFVELLVWMSLGLSVYFIYGIKNSLAAANNGDDNQTGN